jgi:hypothetical protein
VQDAPGQKTAQLGHPDAAIAGMAHGHRQRADVIVVAVGDGDGVQVFATQQLVERQGFTALAFRVHPRVHKQTGIIQFDQPGTGADLGVGIEVRDMHWKRHQAKSKAKAGCAGEKKVKKSVEQFNKSCVIYYSLRQEAGWVFGFPSRSYS